MADEDDRISPHGMEELRYMQQVYQNQYSILTNSLNIVLRELQELNTAQKTLENIDLVEGKDTLTGIGGDFYLVGRIHNTKSALVGIGAGYVVEKETDSAKTHVADLIKKHTDELNKLTKNRRELENALMEISYRIENSR
ncbi:MAG: prefoldin subunit alpha [Candidatus Micrarchaeaceae archaeon]|jgi:prefoldin alpha subunit